jgi:large subunit ribosomal protein L15
MQIHEIKRENKNKVSIKIGRGGKRGKTSGRGHKGQKQHGGHGIRPEWRDAIKKIPKLRGRGVNINRSIKADAQAINVSRIENNFEAGEIVSVRNLITKNLVRKIGGKQPRVKILGNGEITKKVTITGCEVSTSAKEKIEKAGGSIK